MTSNYVLTLPYISSPIEQFKNYQYVGWSSGIYPKFKGTPNIAEREFFASLIRTKAVKSVLDLGVGGGAELSSMIEVLNSQDYQLTRVEANEFDPEFIIQALTLFGEKKQNVTIHRGNWLEFPQAVPFYNGQFDFAFLTGNSLTYIGGATREYTISAQRIIVKKFAEMIRPGGYFFVDSRNYDYIRTFMNHPHDRVMEATRFDYTSCYHGTDLVQVVPAYISETVVVLHYYDHEEKKWSKLDLYPIYQKDMLEILKDDFELEQVFYDFDSNYRDRSLFVQYLARKK